MGLFCLANGEKSSDYVEAAIANLRLFLEECKHDRGTIRCSNAVPNEYLITDFAIGYLEKALIAYRIECKNNPNINPPVPPDPLIDIEQALQHAKGDEIYDCSMILVFFRQHFDQIDEFLGRLDPKVHSRLGVTAALRYTWQSADKYPNWKKLITSATEEFKDEPDLFCGLREVADK